LFEPRSTRRSSNAGDPAPIGAVKSRFPTASKITAGHAAALAAAPASSTEAAEGLVGRFLASGKLQLEELICSGGMGLVYRAMHQGLSMPVAVKVLHEN